jgi:hypothetical protein
MGLVGDNCGRCREAAENDKGLAGRWWRFWAEVRWFAPWTLNCDSELTKPPRRGAGAVRDRDNRRTTTLAILVLELWGVSCSL